MNFLQKNSKRPSKLDSTGPSEHFSVSNFLFRTWKASVRHVNRNFFWVKKVTTIVRLFFLHFVKKPKSITRRTPGCFASRNLVNMPFGKMETFCLERNFFRFLNFEIQKTSVFFRRITVTGGKEDVLKRNSYVKTVHRWCFDTISGLFFNFAYLFDKGFYITCNPRPVHAIIQWNSFRRQIVFHIFNCFAMLSERVSEYGNMESNLCSVVKTAVHNFSGFFW